MKTKHSAEAALFLQKWNRLDGVIKNSLAVPVEPVVTPPTAGKRTKSSKKTRRHKKK
jgi:hypothetical protein